MTAREFIPIAKPDIGTAEIQAVSEVMRSGNITSGEHVINFEKQFAMYCGTQHAIATSIGRGDKRL